MKKQTIALLLAGTFILGTLGGCASEEETLSYKDYISQAEDAMDSNNYGTAIDLLEEAIDLDDEDEDAYLLLAEIYIAMDNEDEAIDVLEDGLKYSESDDIEQWLIELGAMDTQPTTTTTTATTETTTTTTASDATTPSVSSSTNATTSSTTEATTTENAFPDKYHWTFSTTYVEGSVVVDMYHTFAELVNSYTEGAVTIDVYTNGVIAGENDALAQVTAGELEFCGVGTTPLWSYSPDAAWILAPFMISDAQTLANVYNSDYMVEIRESWAENNNLLDLGGAFYRGMRQVTSVTKVEDANDLSGLTLRLPSNQMWNTAWQTAGCNTVSIALGELYTAMQTGVCQACDNPLSESGGYNIAEVTNYVTLTNHVADFSLIVMDNNLYESLPTNYQTAISAACGIAMDLHASNIEAEEEWWLQNYLDAGAELVEFDSDSVRAELTDWWKEMFVSDWTSISYEDAMLLIQLSTPR